jgi:hypothetical protein
MRRQRYVRALLGSRSAAALVAALVLAGCSGEESEPAATLAAPAPAPAAPSAEPAGDRSQAVYDAYFRHCREFTWRALVYPKTARNEVDAARQYAGPPRQYRRPAFRGCLAGLRADTATITLDEIKRLAEEEAKEHGLEG